MPYTPSIRRQFAIPEPAMPYFHVVDPAINASHGAVWGDTETHAKHSGTRTLEAVQIVVWAS